MAWLRASGYKVHAAKETTHSGRHTRAPTLYLDPVRAWITACPLRTHVISYVGYIRYVRLLCAELSADQPRVARRHALIGTRRKDLEWHKL